MIFIIQIISLVIIFCFLVYLIYLITTSKLLFLSSIRALKNSVFSLFFLTILLSVTMTLINGTTTYVSSMNNTIDTLIVNNNLQHGYSLTRGHWNDYCERSDDDINQAKVTSNFDCKKISEDFNSLTNIANAPWIDPSYNGFHDYVWSKYEDPNNYYFDRVGISYMLEMFAYVARVTNQDIGYKHNITMRTTTSSFGGPLERRKTLTLIRMPETSDPTNVDEIHFNVPLNIEGEEVEISLPHLLKGELPSANDSNLGINENNPVPIVVFQKFGESNNIDLTPSQRKTIALNPTKSNHTDNVGITSYVEVVGYFEMANYIYAQDSTQLFPNYEDFTYAMIPAKAFDTMFMQTGGDTISSSKIVFSFGKNVGKKTYLDRQTPSSINFQIYEEIKKFNETGITNEHNYGFGDYIFAFNRKENKILPNQKPWDFNEKSNASIYYFEENIRISNQLNWIILILFITINIVFIFLVLKRKILSNAKHIGVLKAIGFKTRHIATSYMPFALFIGLLGSFIGLGLGVFVKDYFTNSMLLFFALTPIPPIISLNIIFVGFVIPTLGILMFIWLITLLIVKRKPIDLLNQSMINKPNIFVKMATPLTQNLHFAISYKTKNTLRAFGKSSFMFVSVFGSVTLLLFAILSNSFVEKAIDVANKTHSFSYLNIKSTNPNGTREYIDTNYVYSDELELWKMWPSSLPILPSCNLNNWQTINDSTVSYLTTTTLERDKSQSSYVKIPVKWDENINSYALQEGTNMFDFFTSLYLFLNTCSNSNPEYVSKKLEDTINSIQYNISLSDILRFLAISQLSTIQSMNERRNNELPSDIDNDPTIIVFNIDEINSELEKPLIHTTIYIKEINGEEPNPIYITDSNYHLHESISALPPDAFNKNDEIPSYNLYDYKDGSDISSKLILYQGDKIPLIISAPLAKNFSLDSGDIISASLLSWESKEYPEDEITKFDFEVVGIYEDYSGLGSYTLMDERNSTDMTILFLIDALAEHGILSSDDPKTPDWVVDSNNPRSVVRVANQTISTKSSDFGKKYISYSANGYNDFYFNTNVPLLSETTTPITSTLPTKVISMSTTYIVETIDNLTNLLEAILGFFLGFAYVIVFVLLIVISKEIVEASKREVSALKALGYSSRKSSGLVLDGQAFIMFSSLFIAIPIAIIVMQLFANLLFMLTGILLAFTATPLEIVIVMGIVTSAFIIMYIIGVLTYKITGPLLALQRE